MTSALLDVGRATRTSRGDVGVQGGVDLGSSRRLDRERGPRLGVEHVHELVEQPVSVHGILEPHVEVGAVEDLLLCQTRLELDLQKGVAVVVEAEAEARALIEAGESKAVEFKATARWNVRDGKPDKTMEAVIVKTVAAFLNSDGGTLLIGVRDDGTVAGLAPDLATLGKRPDLDGYQQFLVQLFGNAWGHHRAACYDIDFPTVRGVPIARVTVRPAPDPVWLKVDGHDKFYIRVGNTSRDLSPPEAAAYIHRHR